MAMRFREKIQYAREFNRLLDKTKADNPSFAAAVPSAFGVGQAYQFAAPAFADLDGDGDADLFVGEGSGEGSGDGILYYKNEGSATAPSFTLQAGGYTGLPNVSSNRRLVPIFAPVDGDADFDAFVGEMRYDAQLTYYRKDPSGFTSQELPTGLVLSGGPDYARSATFADIDGDGDLDAFVSRTDSSYDSLITYFENTGSASDPAFTDRATSLGLGVTSDYGPAFPTFVDIDADGDFDAFVGDEDGNILFFRNTGTSASPSFAAAQPNQFGIAAVSNGPAVPAFVDIDADGDFDLFVGDDMGYIWFFENTNF